MLMTTRLLWLLLGYAAAGFGIVGIFLPLVPATPFLLVAAYAFARSSPRLHHWLTSHRLLGPFIDNWQRFGAISPQAKTSAVVVMGVTLLASWVLGAGAMLMAVQVLATAGACAFILSRPNGPAGK